MNITNLFLIGLISLVTCLNAQEEITEQFRYQIGDTSYYETYTDIEVSSGDSGIDITWDFTNLELTQPVVKYLVYSNPDELTGLAASARDKISEKSNIAVRWFTNDGTNEFILFRYQDENVVESYGSFYIPFPQVTKGSNPLVLYTFPMPLYTEFTNSHTDSIFQEDNINGGWTFSVARERQNEVVFDGIGSVITEKGTYPNCMRLKRSTDGRTIYTWIQNKLSNVVVSITEFDDKPLMSSILFGPGDTQSTSSTNRVKLSSKPFIQVGHDKSLHINYEVGVYDYFMLDNTGRKIQEGTLHQFQTNTKYDLLKNINSPFGIYYIVLVNNETGYFTTTSVLIP
jgi:hypothetical protein